MNGRKSPRGSSRATPQPETSAVRSRVFQVTPGPANASLRLSRGAAFLVAASSLILVFAGAGVPIPLFNTYRAEDGITNADLAVASVGYFAAAAIALLVLGRLSNYVGRRPVAIAALVSARGGCLVLAGAHGIAALPVGRILQGLGCGLASSSTGAYVVDTAPTRPSWLAAAITGGAPMIGVPLGALGSGILVDYAPSPRLLIYLIVAGLLGLCVLLTVLGPETMGRQRGLWPSLVPRVQVPAGSGRLLLAAGAAFVATWLIGGFYQAFSPTVTAEYLGTASAVMTAAVFSSVMILNPFGGPASGRLKAAVALRVGMSLYVIALIGIVVSLHAHALGPFVAASLLVGLAQGVACTGAMKALLARATTQQRARLLATLYLISYCGVALPGLAARQLVQMLGVLHLAEAYAALGVISSIVAVVAMQGASPAENGTTNAGLARKSLARTKVMKLIRAGSQPSQKGPAKFFTGAVRIDPLNTATEPARVSCASVTFEPGARTAWHTHPLGQTLIVTAGCGWTQCEGEPIVEIRAGDVVWCPANHRHWHGATPTTAMTHIAIQEALDGKAVDWMEHVSDEQYSAGPPCVVNATAGSD